MNTKPPLSYSDHSFRNLRNLLERIVNDYHDSLDTNTQFRISRFLYLLDRAEKNTSFYEVIRNIRILQTTECECQQLTKQKAQLESLLDQTEENIRPIEHQHPSLMKQLGTLLPDWRMYIMYIKWQLNVNKLNNLDKKYRVGEKNLKSHFEAVKHALLTLLSQTEKQIEDELRTWLNSQVESPADEPTEKFTQLNRYFERAVTLYSCEHAQGNAVHTLAQACLKGILAEENPQPKKILVLLESERAGLKGTTLRLPSTNWVDTWDKSMQNAIGQSMHEVSNGSQLNLKEFKKLFDQLENQLSPLPRLEDCQQKLQLREVFVLLFFDQHQQKLQSGEALVQPFFDLHQEKLRVLWLDAQHIAVWDLPETCASLELWTTLPQIADGVIDRWSQKLKAYKEVPVKTSCLDWETISQTSPVQAFANQLSQWAKEYQVTLLTVIFPAPLGQLPWEPLPKLERLVMREVSVEHWLREPAQGHNASAFVMVDGSVPEDSVMYKEAQWVAKSLKTDLNNRPTLFDTLNKLSSYQYVHLSTHGKFTPENPIESYLTLNKETKLPLWMSSALQPFSAHLVVLSACESNVYGHDTEGLLAPVGIGPSLAAAGAMTVVGTLWPCDELAAYCFSYYFYRIAENEPTLPWHQVVAKARNQLREMTQEDLNTIKDTLHLDNSYRHKVNGRGEKPFARSEYWAGFIALGRACRV